MLIPFITLMVNMQKTVKSSCLRGYCKKCNYTVNPRTPEKNSDSNEGKPFRTLESADFTLNPVSLGTCFYVAYHHRPEKSKSTYGYPDVTAQKVIAKSETGID